MRTLNFLILIFPALLAAGSCKNASGDKAVETKLTTMDSLHALANDSVKIIGARIDPFSDRVKYEGIDTRKVHPKEIVAFSMTLIGVPYKYGSTDPLKGFDCSGFITYLFQHFGIKVPRSSIDFANLGRHIDLETSRCGDLILFTGTDSTKRFVGHMGMIVRNENGSVSFIHSTSGKAYGVTITKFDNYYKSRYMKTIRIFPNSSWD